MGYYHQGLNDFPKYIATISSGSQTFTGIEEFQLWGNTLVFSRLEYRYKHKKDIFAHLIFNWLISAKADNNVSAEKIGSQKDGWENLQNIFKVLVRPKMTPVLGRPNPVFGRPNPGFGRPKPGFGRPKPVFDVQNGFKAGR